MRPLEELYLPPGGTPGRRSSSVLSRLVGERKGQGINRSICIGSHVTTLAGETTSTQYRGFTSAVTWPGSSVYILFGQIFPRAEGSVRKTLFFMCLKTTVVSVASFV